jgi:hypothetical protein
MDHRVQQSSSAAAAGAAQSWFRHLERHPLSLSMPTIQLEAWWDRYLITCKEGNLNPVQAFHFASDHTLYEW